MGYVIWLAQRLLASGADLTRSKPMIALVIIIVLFAIAVLESESKPKG